MLLILQVLVGFESQSLTSLYIGCRGSLKAREANVSGISSKGKWKISKNDTNSHNAVLPTRTLHVFQIHKKYLRRFFFPFIDIPT